MKKQIRKTLMFSLVAVALMAAPAISRAQDSNSAPAAADSTSKKLPFHGKAAAVDTAAMTLTVGTMVINVTSDTRISKNGKPATLEDIKEGDAVSGSYVKGDDGKLNASMIRDGLKTKKKKKAAASDSSTNAPAAN